MFGGLNHYLRIKREHFGMILTQSLCQTLLETVTLWHETVVALSFSSLFGVKLRLNSNYFSLVGHTLM